MSLCAVSRLRLVHGTGAWPARIAAAPATAGGSALHTGLFTTHGKAGELLLEPFAFAFGAGGFPVAQNDSFKMVVTLLTDIFKNRHMEPGSS